MCGRAHVEREVHAGKLPVALEILEGVVEDAIVHEARVIVAHDERLEPAALGDLVALDEEEDEVLAALAHRRVLPVDESGHVAGHHEHCARRSHPRSRAPSAEGAARKAEKRRRGRRGWRVADGSRDYGGAGTAHYWAA